MFLQQLRVARPRGEPAKQSTQEPHIQDIQNEFRIASHWPADLQTPLLTLCLRRPHQSTLPALGQDGHDQPKMANEPYRRFGFALTSCRRSQRGLLEQWDAEKHLVHPTAEQRFYVAQCVPPGIPDKSSKTTVPLHCVLQAQFPLAEYHQRPKCENVSHRLENG